MVFNLLNSMKFNILLLFYTIFPACQGQDRILAGKKAIGCRKRPFFLIICKISCKVCMVDLDKKSPRLLHFERFLAVIGNHGCLCLVSLPFHPLSLRFVHLLLTNYAEFVSFMKTKKEYLSLHFFKKIKYN